jgi:undecaprenyl-diphosphatase
MMENILFCLKSFCLGIVEGVTEFLPISSTGHLIVFEKLLGFQGSSQYLTAYSYIIQLGAILAVIVLYRQKILATLHGFFPKKENDVWVRSYSQAGLRFWLTLAVACIPGFIVVMAIGDLVDAYFFNGVSVAVALILGGIAMILAERFCKKGQYEIQKGKCLSVTTKQALMIGGFQCLSVIPGMSRSASTMIGGWFAGLSTPASAEFSFFLAIPVMVGMGVLKLLQLGGFGTMRALELISLGIGFVISFVVALLVVKKFISFLQKNPCFHLLYIAFCSEQWS